MAVLGGDFSGYETITFDPGWAFTVGVIVICSLLNLSLPLLLRLAKHWDDKKIDQKTGVRSNVRNLLEDNVDIDANDIRSEMSASPKKRRRLHTQSPSHAPSAFSDYQSAFSADYHSTAKSVISSTAISQIASNILEARPRKNRRHILTKTSKEPKRSADNPPRKQTPASLGDPLADFDESSVCASIMSNLDQDAVSVRDAIDAHDGATNHKIQVDQTSPNGLWECLLDIAEWEFEMKRMSSLTIPYSIQGVADGLFQIINVAMIGNLIGVREANAYVVVTILIEWTNTITYGFCEATGTLGPQADGAGNDLLVGRYLQLGMLFYIILSIPSLVIWSILTEKTIVWFGFDPETAEIGQGYAFPFLAMAFFDGVSDCLHQFLDITDHEKYSTVVGILSYALQTIALVVMAVLGYTDLVFIGIVQAFVSFLMMVFNFSWAIYMGWLDDYWEGLVLTSGLRDRRAVHTMLITAIPLSVSYVLTYGEWEVMTIFAGFMGPAEVATWGIVGFVWDTFEQLTEGLAGAAEVRVGFYMGAGQPDTAKFVAEKAIYLGIVVAIFVTGFLFVIAEYLPVWLTPDPTLQKMIFEILPLMGFGNLLNINATVCWSIITAQGRVRLAMLIELVSSWLIVLPVCAIFVYGFNYNLLGPVAAIVFGYSVNAVTVTYVLFRSPWAALSQIVISRNTAEGALYDDYDWADLPPPIREAAEVLGYNRNMWDNEKEPPSGSKEWDDLSRAEQEAAALLGYNRKKWDHDSDDNETTTDGRHSRSSNLDDYDWDELPPDIKGAAEVLGYTKQLWDLDGEPPSDEKYWSELNPREQEAARLLGYDKAKWDDNDPDDDNDDTEMPAKNYDDMDWDELPADAKKAAKVLGYDKKMWDTDGTPPSDDKYWHELSEREQKAAAKLGYNQEKWNDGSEPESEEDNTPTDVSYDDMDWDELPADAKKAAKVLGYDKKMWDTDGTPPSDDKYWHELSEREQKAAAKLGYNQEKWNDGSEPESEEDNTPTDVSYDDMDWDELPADAKQAAKVLGYDKKMWDTDGTPPSDDKYWHELSEREQKAAAKLGYNQEKWNNGSEPQSEEDNTPTYVSYDDRDWDELPADAKKAAKVLGYDKKMWDTDGTPPSDDKYWHELRKREQKAAAKLGYNQEKWNDGSEPESEEVKKQAVVNFADGSTRKTDEDEGAPQAVDFDDMDWDELPARAQRAAGVLAYTRKMWDSDEPSPVEDKYWQELTKKEQMAARDLGYKKEKWNPDGHSERETDEEEQPGNFEKMKWIDLPVELRTAARVLGYSKSTWDSDELPSSEKKDWFELNEKEQDAARRLGFNQDKWKNAGINSY